MIDKNHADPSRSDIAFPLVGEKNRNCQNLVHTKHVENFNLFKSQSVEMNQNTFIILIFANAILNSCKVGKVNNKAKT